MLADASSEASYADRFGAVSSDFWTIFEEVRVETRICLGGGDRGDLSDWLRRRRLQVVVDRVKLLCGNILALIYR